MTIAVSRITALTWAIAGLGAGAFVSTADASTPLPPSEVDIAQLVRELQWTSPDPRNLSMVWVFPRELMHALVAQGGIAELDEEMAAIAVFDPYLPIGIVRGGFDASGAPFFENANVIRSSVRLETDRGHRLGAVSRPDSLAQLALAQMQETLSAALGDLGAHTTFLLFDALDPDGDPIFPLNRRATLTVDLAAVGPLPSERVTYHLPASSLLRGRRCPACGSTFNGAWVFCPWDGRHLVDEDGDLAGTDEGATDEGATDAGAADAGAADAGAADAGAADAGAADVAATATPGTPTPDVAAIETPAPPAAAADTTGVAERRPRDGAGDRATSPDSGSTPGVRPADAAVSDAGADSTAGAREVPADRDRAETGAPPESVRPERTPPERHYPRRPPTWKGPRP